MFTNFRLKIRNFFKKYKYILLLVFIALLVLISINQFLKKSGEITIPQVSYNPNKPIMNEKEEVPEKEEEGINKLFDTYVQYCNEKNYEEAYNMLSSSCKEVVYPRIEDYKEYIDIVFDQKKIYNIQNMSNLDGNYIYRVRFLDDILATGLTGEEKLWYDEDIITIVTENNEKKLNIRKFIQKKDLMKVYENEYMKLEVENSNIQYEAEVYHLKVTNRSEYTIVLADFTQSSEVTIQFGTQKIDYTKEYNNKIVVKPGETKYYTLMFEKDYDLTSPTDSMSFNYVRILKSYSGKEETRQEELDHAEKIYGVKINL